MVRTAGHTVGPEVLGSVEYAVTVLGTPLVVVLGHDSCGAVQAARESAATGTAPSGHLRAVVDAVLPSLRRAEAEGVDDIDGIVDIHIAQTVETLLAAVPGAGRRGGAGAVRGGGDVLPAGRRSGAPGGRRAGRLRDAGAGRPRPRRLTLDEGRSASRGTALDRDRAGQSSDMWTWSVWFDGPLYELQPVAGNQICRFQIT